MNRIIYCIAFLLICTVGISQDVPQVTNKIYLKNVTLHSQPGQEAILGSILIEDGIIAAVGNNVFIPFDAKIIEGDSMHAYAGFIAPLSYIGLEKPKESNEAPKVKRSGYPPNDVAGITPERSVANAYKKDEKTIANFRKEGFTIAHSVPYGGMMPGKGSVISLNGKDYHEAVLSKDQSMFATWKTARRVFPATLIGIMSKWRELYRNAELSHHHAQAYKSNPQNKKRPSPDAATSALFAVLEKKMPVFFVAEKHRDVARTLQLQKELNFDLVISEARDIDRILDRTKKSNARVLLSLDLPKAEKEDKKKGKEEKKETEVKEAEPAEQTAQAETNEAPPETSKAEPEKKMEKEEDEKSKQLKERKKAAIARYVGQAKTLRSSDVPVSFSYLETKAKDVHTNLRRMVKDGLSEDDALAALTTEAADVLNISETAGTLESGKIGNVVLSTKSIFDDEAKIKYVVIDGQIHEYEIKEKKKKSGEEGEEPVDISGSWSYTIEVPGMTSSGTMTFTKNGDSYDVELTNSQMPDETVSVSDIDMNGNVASFSYSPPVGGMNITLDNELTFDGDTFEGTVDVGDFGSFEITGQKDNPE